MKEYNQSKQGQQSRAIAHNGGGSRQLKSLVDNRSEAKKIDTTSSMVQFYPVCTGRVTQLAKGDCCYVPRKNTPYVSMLESKMDVGPGEEFSASQRAEILASNASVNSSGIVTKKIFSAYNSDSDGNALTTKDYVNDMLAEVDHVVPKSLGGGNTVMNAMVISSRENTQKGNTYPYGGYSGFAVLDPTNNIYYNSKTAAVNAGATNVNNLP